MALVFSGPSSLVADPAGGAAVLAAVIQEQRMGDVIVPSFRVEIPNPGVTSLLAIAARGSIYENGSLVASGRMTAAPADLGGDTVTLEFTCVPDDEDEVLRAEADTWRVGEVEEAEMLSAAAIRYDPLFYPRDAEDDPMNVLAATTKLWRWHRATNQLDTADMAAATPVHVIGGDGIEGSLRVSLLDPPKAKMKLRLVASWTQEARGRQMWALSGQTKTYSFDDFIGAWPSAGTPIGTNTGWTIADPRITLVEDDLILDPFDVSPADFANGDEAVTACQLLLGAKTVYWQMRLGYEYSQQREELLDIEMSAGIQPVLGDDRQEQVDVIQLAPLNLDSQTDDWTAENPVTLDPAEYVVGDERQANGKVWRCLAAHTAGTTFQAYDLATSTLRWEQIAKKSAMPSATAGRFFDGGARGERAIRHGIGRMARIMTERAHCIEVSFDTTWSKGKAMRAGDLCSITHPHIGTAVGFVTDLRLVFDGSFRAEVTMVVPPGEGGATAMPDYTLTAPAPVSPVNVASLPVMSPRVFQVENAYAAQKTAATGAVNPVAVIEAMPTRLRLAVHPLTQQDLLTRRMKATCGALGVRQGIAL